MKENKNRKEQERVNRKIIRDRLAAFFSKGNVLYISLAAVMWLILMVYMLVGARLEDKDLIDYSTFSAVVLEALLAIMAAAIRRWILNRAEDPAKLTTDYDSLTKLYGKEPHLVNHDYGDEIGRVIFPVMHEAWLSNKQIVIQDNPSAEYSLPDMVVQHYDELFVSHATSNIYNNINIRVNDWNWEGDNFVITTGRTTYYNGLVTNRCSDYEIGKSLSVRQLFESGPVVHPLRYSQLSNHIGFNGFIESCDGKICFVERKGSVSIGKRTYGDSIGASLKTKYALNSEYKFTREGLMEGMLEEIDDELKIKRDKLQILENEEKVQILAAYRDLLESGKPQLLMYAKCIETAKEIEDNFIEAMKKKREKRVKQLQTKKKFTSHEKKELKMETDGDRLVWFTIDQLRSAIITPGDLLFPNGEHYPMVPSASACVQMYLDYLEGMTEQYFCEVPKDYQTWQGKVE